MLEAIRKIPDKMKLLIADANPLDLSQIKGSSLFPYF